MRPVPEPSADAPARLLDVHGAAAYLGGLSSWSVRGLIASGVLTPVRLPSARRPGEASRRIFFDVRDLDRLVDQSKETSSAAPNAQLSKAAIKGWQRTPARTRKGAAT